MDCAEASDLLPEHVRGSLSPGEAERLGAHLRACASCREDVEFVRLLHRAAPVPPPDLGARILTALQTDTAVSAGVAAYPSPVRASRPRIWALATAATVVLAVGTAYVMQRQAAGPADEEVWQAFFDQGSMWRGGDGVVAGAPVFDDLSDLSDEALLAVFAELGR